MIKLRPLLMVVKNGGKIIFDDSRVYDSSGTSYFIYNFGSMINVTESSLDNIGVMITADGGDVNFDNGNLNGNFYLKD